VTHLDVNAAAVDETLEILAQFSVTAA
jgi:hypothetical protein